MWRALELELENYLQVDKVGSGVTSGMGWREQHVKRQRVAEGFGQLEQLNMTEI